MMDPQLATADDLRDLILLHMVLEWLEEETAYCAEGLTIQ